jgi:hypothetical protein
MEFIVVAIVVIGGAILLGGLFGYIAFKMWEEVADGVNRTADNTDKEKE